MDAEFDIKTIEHLSTLCQIELSDEEKYKLADELKVILDAVHKVSELDLSNVEPLSNPIPIENVYRDDVVKESLPIERALSNAPNHENDQFKVAKIL